MLRRALVLAVVVAAAFSGVAGLAGAQTPTPKGTPAIPGPPRDPADPRNAPPRTLGPFTAENETKLERERRDVNPRPGESVDDAARRSGLIPECDYTRGKKVPLPGRDGKRREVQLAADACLDGDVSVFMGGMLEIINVGGEKVFVDSKGEVRVHRERPEDEVRVKAKVRWLEEALR